MTEVIVTDEFEAWYNSLNEQDSDAVYRVVGLLESLGVCLEHPHSSALKGSQYAMRELRVQSGGRPLRILYAFDPKRQAVLLLGGDKTGKDRFYEEMIPKAEQLWREYLAEQE
ncbi:type II toxin-antitoxin system RelE/ParE family toxin [Sorangium sp. So ce854]|uniref:type II toxin-antitoxin system RelE/ParE family toxin n=1 Tax=Sorangium sp. So ce854 TaxID=3133322 RepID=UPI003F5FFBF5